jgi:ubiquinone/menaquinone biosynthesis C-methylase UbiE
VKSDAFAGKLERLLRNEADMAAKRRVLTVIDYLAIEPQDRVLDCGCGLGWFVKILSELYDSELYGCDFDVPRLAVAHREAGGRAGLSAADVLRLPYPDRSFDKIVLSEVLEHLPDDAGGLAEVRRVLKPGGVIAITVPNHDYPFLWDPVNWTRERLRLEPIRSGFFGGLWTNHERLYTREEIVRLVEAADLEVEDVRQFVHYCFPFAHNLVYGLGMRLVQAGICSDADRFRYDAKPGPAWSPLNVARAVFNRIDRRNDPVSDENRTTVILSVKARRRAA